MLTVFYPTEKLPKLKVYKAFTVRSGVMYCQVRWCARWSGEYAKAVL